MVQMTRPAGIPRLIHQTWKSDQIPPHWQPLQQSWRRWHPDWEYRLWTDEDNAAFIARCYPEFLPVYEGYDKEIKRVDAVRYFIMHYFGGVYADLDFEALRPLDDLLTGKQLVLAREPPSHASADSAVRSRGLDSILGNAFLASIPRHPFWEAVADGLVTHRHETEVLDATGPFLLTRVYQEYPHPHRLEILDSEYLYPVSKWAAWRGYFDHPNWWKKVGEQAYAVHRWHGSFRRAELLELVRRRLNRA